MNVARGCGIRSGSVPGRGISFLATLRHRVWWTIALAALCAPALTSGNDVPTPNPGASTQTDEHHVTQEIQKYRDMLQDGNPAELMELRGEELWTLARGPRNATLEKCDLGLGAGVVAGAYAQLPRFFADTGKVQDVESRLAHCMVTLQGLSVSQATQNWHRPNSDMEALATYVATQSKGQAIAIPTTHAAERQSVALGEELFHRRAGPLDFSCATCHAQTDKRIRLQELPNFSDGKSAQQSMITWPAYRVSQSAVWTMERRLIDCLRQMRYPDAAYLSEAVIALQSYLQHQARGGIMQAPGIKR